ncbi:MAG: YbaN family protein [Pseudomonadota bacterium]|nr:YbaN family protein [Pseudomonadota bacterium]
MSDPKKDIHVANETSNPLAKLMWVSLGSLFVGLGAIGVIVPGLPTTPFLILAAACYIRSSQRLYDWLISNKRFGPYLKDYREGKGIPRKAKRLAVVMIVVFVSFSVVFGIEDLTLKIVVGLLGLIGLLYVLFKVPVAKD